MTIFQEKFNFCSRPYSVNLSNPFNTYCIRVDGIWWNSFKWSKFLQQITYVLRIYFRNIQKKNIRMMLMRIQVEMGK